jgi:hypothetical protein
MKNTLEVVENVLKNFESKFEDVSVTQDLHALILRVDFVSDGLKYTSEMPFSDVDDWQFKGGSIEEFAEQFAKRCEQQISTSK